MIDKNSRLWAYIQLTRFDKPVGIELLLWPTLWAVWLAGQGHPSLKNIIIFSLGAVLMRAAGCAINDYADRDFDRHVARTKDRPLASGKITDTEALVIFAVLVLLSSGLLLLLPVTVFYWAFGALGLAVLYPFTKRVTYLPQFVLGAAFSWAIPMAYVASNVLPSSQCWLLYAANLCWTVAYDTQYAMTDRDDDLKAGIKSTAILFGKYDLAMIGALQVLSLFLLLWVFRLAHLLPIALIVLLLMLALFVYQYRISRNRLPANTFAAFKHNVWVGRLVFVGIFLSYAAQGWFKG